MGMARWVAFYSWRVAVGWRKRGAQPDNLPPPPIQVDEGLVPLEGCPGETSTRGLEGLASACAEYASAGARFAKWRAALKVGGCCPSEKAIETNAAQLAEYAAICQVGVGEQGSSWSRMCRPGARRGARHVHGMLIGAMRRQHYAGTGSCAATPVMWSLPTPQAQGMVPIVEPGAQLYCLTPPWNSGWLHAAQQRHSSQCTAD